MDEIAHCLICGASNSDAPGPFCCEGCHDVEVLTTICRQCNRVRKYGDERVIAELSATLHAGTFQKSDLIITPYCSSCTDIAPQRPIGEVEVFSIIVK